MRWKWIVSIAVVLIVALIAAVYVILSSYDFNDIKPQIAKAAWDATGRELTIGGEIDLEIGLTPALVLTDIKFQNAPWGSRPELIKIRRFEVQVALLPLLSGNIEIKRLILVEPDVLIETDKSGKSNLAFETPKKTAPQQEEEKEPTKGITKLPALTFNKLQVEKGRFVYMDGQSSKTYEVMLNRLITTSADINSPVEIALNGDFNKEPFEITGTLGPLPALVNSQRVWSLDLTTKFVNATINLEGSVMDALTQRGIDLGFRVRARDLIKLSKLGGKELPLDEPLEISGRAADTGPKNYRISDLKVTLGSSDLGGSVEINLARKPVRVTAMLSSKKLDLRPLMSEGKEAVKAESKQDKPTKKPKKIFPDDPLPLYALEQAEGNIKIRAGQILFPKFAVNDLTTDIFLKDGHLSIKPIKAAIGDSKLNGLITLHSRGKTAAMSTQLKAEGLELGSMLKELNITEVMEGNLDVDINLKGQGGSVATLMAGLDGHTSVIMSNGRINNKYINLLGGDLSTGLFRLFNPAKEKADYTEINCLVSRFDIKKGLAKSTALVFDTSHMSVVGEGKIDLKTEKLDLSLKPMPKEGIGASGLGKLSLSLGELAKPFKLAGTLAEPALSLDPTQAAMILGKAIGGIALFGPAGIVTVLASGSKGHENPCLAAIEAAKKGAKFSRDKKPAEKKTKHLKGAVEDVGRTLKKLFGK